VILNDSKCSKPEAKGKILGLKLRSEVQGQDWGQNLAETSLASRP